MTLKELAERIDRALCVEVHPKQGVRGQYWRCYFPDVLVTDSQRAAVTTTAVGTGNEREAALEELIRKLRGKWLRVRDLRGNWSVHPVPINLTA